MALFVRIIIFFSLALFNVKAEIITWQDQKFEIVIPKKWQKTKDFFGIPFTALNDNDVDQVRATIQVIPTVVEHIEFNEKSLKGFNRKFRENREKWLKKRNGKVLKIFNERVENINGRKALVIRSQYKWMQKSIDEKSIYINCDSKLYHLKMIAHLTDRIGFEEAEKTLRTFQCKS